jgi:DNA-directed RNA polymerase subunit RPC12/RpoP
MFKVKGYKGIRYLRCITYCSSTILVKMVTGCVSVTTVTVGSSVTIQLVELPMWHLGL